VLVFVMTTLLCMYVYALSQSIKQVSPRPHRHVRLSESIIGDATSRFAMVETSLDANLKKENVVVNRSGTYKAFTVSGTRLYVVEVKTGKSFEIRGLPFEWRPFSDLVWADNRTLVFDRWSQPHYGVHYAVNVKTK